MPLPRALYGSDLQLRSISIHCRVSQASIRLLQLPGTLIILSAYNNRLTTSYHTTAPLRASPLGPRHCPFPTMVSKLQRRQHGSHSHAHNHDNTYLTSPNRKDAGVRITRIGLYVNFLMALGKATGGYFLNSQSLMADAFHSLTDLVSDILTLGTVAWSLKAPTPRFPSGYGKIESLGSLGVSGLLLAGGLGLGWHSFEILYNMWFVDAAAIATEHMHHGHDHGQGSGSGAILGHSHSHNPADMGIPNLHAAWIAGGSIVIKEYLYRASEYQSMPDVSFILKAYWSPF